MRLDPVEEKKGIDSIGKTVAEKNKQEKKEKQRKVKKKIRKKGKKLKWENKIGKRKEENFNLPQKQMKERERFKKLLCVIEWIISFQDLQFWSPASGELLQLAGSVRCLPCFRGRSAHLLQTVVTVGARACLAHVGRCEKESDLCWAEAVG